MRTPRPRFITYNRPGGPIPRKSRWLIAAFCLVSLVLGTAFFAFMGYPFYRYEYNKHHNYAITCTVKDSGYKTVGALYAPERLVVESQDCEELHISRMVNGVSQQQALEELTPGTRVTFHLGEKKIGGYHYIVRYELVN